MSSIHAIGVIATDLVRKETRQGVLTTFRFASGLPGRGQLWIDVETWGHAAGVLNAHGNTGRGIALAGRITQKSWRDRNTGQARSRLVITSEDFDFLDPADKGQVDIPNHVMITGQLASNPQNDPTATSDALGFAIATGKAGSKTGRLLLAAEAWGRTLDPAKGLRKGTHVAASGRLSYRTRPNPETGEKQGQFYLSIYNLDIVQRLALTGATT